MSFFATACEIVTPPARQPLWCEECGDPCTADDWIAGLGALLCGLCLERLMDNLPEEKTA